MRKRKKKKSAKSSKKTADKHILEQEWLAVNQVIELTDEFCKKFLNEDYRELCEDLTWAVYDEGLPLESGKPASWASGIVHAIGYANFLGDPSRKPYMTTAELAAGFGVSVGTMMAKSRIIRDELDLIQLDPDWCIPAMLKDNPLVWTIDVGGFLMDVRYAPPEIQQEAYRLGLIPFIPADQPEPESDTGPKVIKFPPGQNEASTSKSPNKPKDDRPGLFEGLEE